MCQYSRPQKLYNAVIVLLPVLAQYSIIGGHLDFDVIAMTIVFCVGLYKNKFVIKKRAGILLLIGYTVFVTIIGYTRSTLYSMPSDIIFRCGKYCLYLFIVAFIGDGLWNYKLMLKYYRRVVYAAFIYILVQTVFYYALNITLPSKIGGTSNIGIVSEFGRLHSFYSEPAELAYSIIPFVCCCLFSAEELNYKKNLKDALIGTLAIFISTSSQGIAITSLIWIVWIVFSAPKRNAGMTKMLGIIGVFAVIFVSYKLGLVDYTMNRLDFSKAGTAFSARNSGYSALTLQDGFEKIFGVGYGNYINKNLYGLNIWGVDVYFSSFAEYLFTTGIIGTVLFYGQLILCCGKHKRLTNIIVIVVFLLSIGGSPTTAKYLPIYLSFIIMDTRSFRSENSVVGESIT